MSAADPYCPDLRAQLVETARELGIPVRDGGTVVTIQGPRFSTRAESKWFQDAGWDVINMTAYPEGYLARELELCYANISMVTDHDVGVEGTAPVSHEAVVEVFNANNERLRELLFAVVPKIEPPPEEHLDALPPRRFAAPACDRKPRRRGLLGAEFVGGTPWTSSSTTRFSSPSSAQSSRSAGASG